MPLAALLFVCATVQTSGGIASSVDLSTHSQQGCVSAKDVDAMQRAHAALTIAAPMGFSPVRFPHYPMAGTLDQDALTGLWMDLDFATNSILDWNCTDHTYDGHGGIDTGFKSWAEQLTGVPVFAAYDGTVYFAQDGWPDMNLNGGVQGNIIGIDHGNGIATSYWHLKLGSVAVSVGQVVKAGQQIAFAASSGNSFGPHLHFQCENPIGTGFDPNEGPCNAQPSCWVHPQHIDYAFHLYDAGVSRVDLTPYYPPAVMPATNQILLSDGPIRFWNWMLNLPAFSTWRVVFKRPNSSVAFDSSNIGFGNNTVATQWWTWWQYDVGEMHTLAGTWIVDFYLNSALQWSAPVEVLAALNPNLNHAPEAITTAFEPAYPTQGDPVFVRVDGPLVQADKDWDKLAYHYVWKVNNVIVRDVTTAMRTDAIAHHVALTGQTLTCSVTTNDGHVNGNTSTSTVVINAACAAPTSYCTATTNSSGTTASIGALGNTSLSHDDLTLIVNGSVPGKVGIFFYGSGATQIAFGNGWRCVTTPVQRLGLPIAADNNGNVELRLSMGTPPISAGPNAILAGSTWYFQWWHRDPLAGGANVNLSNGLAATFCP